MDSNREKQSVADVHGDPDGPPVAHGGAVAPQQFQQQHQGFLHSPPQNALQQQQQHPQPGYMVQYPFHQGLSPYEAEQMERRRTEPYFDVTFDDFLVTEKRSKTQNDDGEEIEEIKYSLASVCGKPTSDISVGDLRRICARLKIRGYKNQRKAYLLEIMGRAKQERGGDGGMIIPAGSPPSVMPVHLSVAAGTPVTSPLFAMAHREAPAPAAKLSNPSNGIFRLLNIVLSDAFNRRLIVLYSGQKIRNQGMSAIAIATGEIDDQGLSASEEPVVESVFADEEEHSFWKDAQAVFNDATSLDAGKLQFNHWLFHQAGINPGRFSTKIGRKKMLDLFREVVSAYSGSRANFMVLEGSQYNGLSARENGPQKLFHDYCRGRLDVLYLHLHMVAKPKLEALLSSGAQSFSGMKLEQTNDASDFGAMRDASPPPQDYPTPKLRAVAPSPSSEQLSQISRRLDAIEARSSEQDTRRAALEESESKRKAASHAFDLMCKISDRMKQLRRELAEEDHEGNITDIKKELEELQQRREKLKQQASDSGEWI